MDLEIGVKLVTFAIEHSIGQITFAAGRLSETGKRATTLKGTHNMYNLAYRLYRWRNRADDTRIDDNLEPGGDQLCGVVN